MEKIYMNYSHLEDKDEKYKPNLYFKKLKDTQIEYYITVETKKKLNFEYLYWNELIQLNDDY